MSKEEKHFGPVWFIPGENRGKYPFCHSIYIEGAKVLIDPASDRERLVQLGENPGVETVWLSHWHEDHFMHLDLFEGLPLCISEADAPPLSDLEVLMDAYGIDEDTRDDWRPIFENQFHFRPRKATRFLRGGEVIDLGTVSVEVISTPGHTPGHLSFFFKGPEILFLGDYDLSKFGPWYGDVESSIQGTIESVEHLRHIPSKMWLTSHESGMFEEAPGRIWDEYVGVIAEREGKLLDLLEKPRTMEEIVGAWIIYKKPREPEAFYEFGERVHMKKHLERLMGQGRVALKGDKYSRV
jgi:glyoxylase-like metal-dependent hydrolase (beta-lactamase superfamily II)